MTGIPRRPVRAGRRLVVALVAVTAAGARLRAQDSMAGMHMSGGHEVTRTQAGSGTSWIPGAASMRMAVRTRGAWAFALGGAASAAYDRQETKRGDTQLALIDWEMAMASRSLAGGTLQLAAMTSIEPWVLGGSGYAELLQTGGTYRHSPIHDRQHPHDALLELSAAFTRALPGPLSLSVYAAAVGEPALGPVAYMHRPSASDDPVAPIGHHWQDASHQSFGVLTLGIGTQSLKLEGSLFNPREPDEHHLIVDYRDATLDSYAGRLSWAAASCVVTSAWWGYLNSHDRIYPTTRMHRYGASVMTTTRGPGGGEWSNTFMWAMNLHHHGAASHAIIHGGPGASPHHHSSSLLAESQLAVGKRYRVFGRVEKVMKNGEEMGFFGGDLTTLYDVRSVVLGATRTMFSTGAVEWALGARGAQNFVGRSLLATYGTRRPAGVAVYVTMRMRQNTTE